jgi:hypothetical protein
LKFGQLLADKILYVWFLIQKDLVCQDLGVCNKVGPEGSKEEASPLSAHYPKNEKFSICISSHYSETRLLYKL